MEPVKVVLIGEAGVGKTSIISRFTKDIFDKDQISSSSAQFISKEIKVNNQSINLDIWDTAGQEKYRSLARMFYKESQVIVFVYEIINKKSFDALKNYWYKEALNNSTAQFYFVVGNKSDLYEREEVSDDEAKAFAKEINGIFKLTSALSNIGIERLFQSIGKKIIDPNYCEEENGIISSNQIKTINNYNIKNLTQSYKLKYNGNEKNNGGKKKKKCCKN
jgi:small GTP-binding protein